MSRLTVLPADDPDAPTLDTHEPGAIAAGLGVIGVRFERWPLRSVAADAQPEALLAAYATDVARLQDEEGYRAADVVRLMPDAPDRDAVRARFLAEHTHAEDEVRFFAHGRGAFFLRDDDKIYRVICGPGDLLAVPAGTRHWFDAGAAPSVVAIRLFTDPRGWVADYTGDPVAERHTLPDLPVS